ncbi:MAG: hypothetical protein CL878_04630 [Dehalococcoidia bacterium]|nr:hypothetical protein [Dehalococcoidia bacterium]
MVKKRTGPLEPGVSHPDTAQELIAMAEADQAMRRGDSWNPDLDRRHTLRLREIVVAIGWPVRSKVGVEAARMAWLLAQHADQDPDFQRECLHLMKDAPEGDVEKQNIAYLEDRVRLKDRRPQLYGTQFRLNHAGDLVPEQIEDPAHLDERRLKAGLGPFSEYEKLMRDYAPPPQAQAHISPPTATSRRGERA